MFLQRPQHAAPRRGFSRPRAVKRVRRQRAGWIMISGMCQRLSSAQDGWPTLVGWTGKQLHYCWIARRPAGATPCASRLRADRGPAAHVPVTQNDIAPLFSNFSKQTRYAEASTRRARSNAPFRRSIGGMRSKRAGNTFFTPLSSDFRAVTKRYVVLLVDPARTRTTSLRLCVVLRACCSAAQARHPALGQNGADFLPARVGAA